MTLDEFLRQAVDPHLDRQILILTQTLFASPGTVGWNGHIFYQAIVAHRRDARSSKQPMTNLPALNPEP
jgi:hypothetical protein